MDNQCADKARSQVMHPMHVRLEARRGPGRQPYLMNEDSCPKGHGQLSDFEDGNQICELVDWP